MANYEQEFSGIEVNDFLTLNIERMQLFFTKYQSAILRRTGVTISNLRRKPGARCNTWLEMVQAHVPIFDAMLLLDLNDANYMSVTSLQVNRNKVELNELFSALGMYCVTFMIRGSLTDYNQLPKFVKQYFDISSEAVFLSRKARLSTFNMSALETPELANLILNLNYTEAIRARLNAGIAGYRLLNLIRDSTTKQNATTDVKTAKSKVISIRDKGVSAHIFTPTRQLYPLFAGKSLNKMLHNLLKDIVSPADWEQLISKKLVYEPAAYDNVNYNYLRDLTVDQINSIIPAFTN